MPRLCIFCNVTLLWLSTGTNNLQECLKGAKHIQESVFENLELKKKVRGKFFIRLCEFKLFSTVWLYCHHSGTCSNG